MRFFQNMFISGFTLIFVLGMVPCFAESTAPYERHDRSHKMADDSHEHGKKVKDKAFKCACCGDRKKGMAHGDMKKKSHHCDQSCEHHKMSQGHGSNDKAELEELFK